MADTTQKYAGKKRNPQIFKRVKIRPRGGSWQADFGTKAGKRDQKSFGVWNRPSRPSTSTWFRRASGAVSRPSKRRAK